MADPNSILLVDDDRLVLEALRRLLAPQGYTLFAACSGAEALRLAREQRPDLVLLDVVLPDLDGLEVCRRIKADPATAASMVILLSGVKTSSDAQADGLEAGADGYVVRPISNRELAARVEAQLRLKAAEDALRESELRFRTIYQHIPVGIEQVTLDLRIEHANPAYCQMLGYEEKELQGKHLCEITQPDFWPENVRQQTRLIQGEIDHYQMETGLVCRDGRIVWGLLDANLIRDAAGQPAYCLGTVVDITARKQAEQEREQLIDELQQALAQVKTLRGLLPICAACKKIRDDQGYWSRVEEYVAQRTEAEFTHSICPECARRLYPELFGDSDGGSR